MTKKNIRRLLRPLFVCAAAFLVAFAVLGTAPGEAENPQPVTTVTVLVVRHAEKGKLPPDNPPLTQAGRERARTLAHTASVAGVDGIYASQLQRTQQTVQPTADLLGLTLKIIEKEDVKKLARRIRTEHQGETVLVAGHSNTVPRIIESLGGESLCPKPFPLHRDGTCHLPEDQFDNLFIVTVSKSGNSTVLRLKYGAPTP